MDARAEETWPLFLGSGECLRFVKTTRDVPEAFLRWLFHITALETDNEHIVWAAGKALKATATKRAVRTHMTHNTCTTHTRHTRHTRHSSE